GTISPFRTSYETFGTPITLAYLYYNSVNNLATISSSGTIYTLFRNNTAPTPSIQKNIW
ncbi:unnamed protein product, partial [marine sediment metagenome]